MINCFEINPDPKQLSLTFYHWKLNGIAAHDFIKISLLQGYITDRNFDIIFFFLSRFSSQTLTKGKGEGRNRTIFYSTLPRPPAHKHWDIYLQLCMWDDYLVFLIVALAFARMLLAEIYHLIKLAFEWLINDAIFVCLLMNWW